jgi:hypothetical protein
MPFPLSQSVTLRVPRRRYSSNAAADRIAEALRSETVEHVATEGVSVRFVCTMTMNIPRPGGQLWLFGFFDEGLISVGGEDTLCVKYQLSTAKAFRHVGALTLLLATPAIFWPWPWLLFASMCFVTLFGGYYLEKRIRFPLWLRKVLTSDAMPKPRPLMLDTGP